MGGWLVSVCLAACAAGVLAFLHVVSAEVDRTTHILAAMEVHERRKWERAQALDGGDSA